MTQISFAVTAKQISAFVVATKIVQSLYSLNPKFQTSSHLLVCVGPGRKPEHWFFLDAAHWVLSQCLVTVIFFLQKQDLETSLNKERMEKVDLETQLRAKVTSLESQLVSMETAKSHEKSRLEDVIVS